MYLYVFFFSINKITMPLYYLITIIIIHWYLKIRTYTSSVHGQKITKKIIIMNVYPLTTKTQTTHILSAFYL